MSNPATSRQSARIVVLGYIVRGPIGGMTWHYLNYVLGLKELGHDVLFLEDSDDYPSCYNPDTHEVTEDPAYGLRYAESVFDRVNMANAWAYFDRHTQRWLGPGADNVSVFVDSSDILINISGVNPVREWMMKSPIRVLIDTDPGFTQVCHLQDRERRGEVSQFTHYFTFGECVGENSCRIPDDGFPWKATRQPIALSQWADIAPPNPEAAFTTVMQWDSYDKVQHNGREFGMKSTSFGPYFDLPLHTASRLEIALGSPDAPRDELRQAGWRLEDPIAVSRTPWTYAQYIARSSGEFSVAKHGYVSARTGWFSERSACYLAAGRPVVLQDTGFSERLPVGNGLFAYTTPDEAVAAIEQCSRDLRAQSTAARDVARAHFDSRTVLSELLEQL